MSALDKIFFTADMHLGHEAMIYRLDRNRPFGIVSEMDDALIERWNKVVPADGTVFHIGDFTLLSTKRAIEYIEKLNGKIFFLSGSHDAWMDSEANKTKVVHWFGGRVNFLPMIHGMKLDVPDNPQRSPDGKTRIVLCHYAMRSWPLSHYGTWHLLGHHHGRLKPRGLSFDVGVDTYNFFPYSFGEVVGLMRSLKPIEDFR